MGCICSVAQSTGGAHQGAHSQQPFWMSMYGQGVGLLDFCSWSYLMIINISSNINMCRRMGLLDFWKMTLLASLCHSQYSRGRWMQFHWKASKVRIGPEPQKSNQIPSAQLRIVPNPCFFLIQYLICINWDDVVKVTCQHKQTVHQRKYILVE